MNNNKARIIVLSNQKGGVAKTTTTQMLAYGLAGKGHRVLTIDADPQMSLTSAFGLDEADGVEKKNIYEIFCKRCTAGEAVMAAAENIDLIPGSLAFYGADMEFSRAGREYLLQEGIQDVVDCYDFILIDTPIMLGVITINALTAADEVIIPIKPAKFAIQCFGQLLNTISVVRKYYNPNIRIDGVVFTLYKSRTDLHEQVRRDLIKKLDEIGVPWFKTVIRDGIAVETSQNETVNPFDKAAGRRYAKSGAISDYKAFIEEFMELEAQYEKEIN